MLDRRAATLNTVSPHLRDSYAATIMPLPRCQIPILTVAGLIQIAALQPLSPTRVSTGSSPTPPSIIALLHMTDLPIVGVQRGHAHSAMVPARSRGRGLLDRLKRAPAQGCHGTGSLFWRGFAPLAFVTKRALGQACRPSSASTRAAGNFFNSAQRVFFLLYQREGAIGRARTGREPVVTAAAPGCGR